MNLQSATKARTVPFGDTVIVGIRIFLKSSCISKNGSAASATLVVAHIDTATTDNNIHFM